MAHKIKLDKPRNGETWKSRAVDLAERFQISYEFHERKNRIIRDCLTSRAKFVCRTEGEYKSSSPTMWYRTSDGSIVACNWDSDDVSIYQNESDVLRLYATFGAEHNKATYRKLAEVFGASVAEVA